MLAEVAGNGVMLRMIKELVTRTSLIIGIFSAPGVTNCRDDDHAELVAALRARDGQKASDLMADHLAHIEMHVDLEPRPDRGVNLMAIFGEVARKAP